MIKQYGFLRFVRVPFWWPVCVKAMVVVSTSGSQRTSLRKVTLNTTKSFWSAVFCTSRAPHTMCNYRQPMTANRHTHNRYRLSFRRSQLPGLHARADGCAPQAAAGRTRRRPRWQCWHGWRPVRLVRDLRWQARHSACGRRRGRMCGSRCGQARHTLKLEEVEVDVEREDVVRVEVVAPPANLTME